MSESTTAFMNGAGPQTKAVYCVKYDANACSCSGVGSPCTDSSQCTTTKRSAYSLESSAISLPKITDCSSRLA